VTKTVVFVQGSKKEEAKFPWMFFHLDPFKDPDPPEAVKLVFFDYSEGTRSTWNSIVLKRGKAPTAKPDDVSPIGHETNPRQVDGTVDMDQTVPSVLALYEWVKKQPKASIRSLQVFSHATSQGPILHNTWEFGPDGIQLNIMDVEEDRDFFDTDFRPRDFFGNNPLAGAEGEKFAAAFASNALIKLWGCFALETPRRLMREYFKAPRGSSGDAQRKAHLEDYLFWIEDSYAMLMANKLDLTVWASAPGYGSEPHDTVPISGKRKLKVKYRGKFPPDLSKDRWWRVSWFFRNQDRGAEFYTRVLKTRVDKTDFVEYRKAWFEAVRFAVTQELTPYITKQLGDKIWEEVLQRAATMNLRMP